jgi:cyclopropane fatty-acyl-phospholipid synthase-like methyltransferase
MSNSVSGAAGRVDREAFLRHYENSMYDSLIREYADGSDFHNFGYWHEDTRSIREAHINLMELLLGRLPVREGKVLDVACGKGASTGYLLRYFRSENVTGIDLGEKQLASARAKAPGCTFLLMDAAELDFPAGSFDVVLCLEAAFHFETREKFLRRAHEVLKPGGTLLMTDVLMTEEAERRRLGRTVENYLEGPDAYRRLLERSGFLEHDVQDATEECWRRYFRDAVEFAHRKLLAREIPLEQLQNLLRPLYGRVPDLRYYLIVSARRG